MTIDDTIQITEINHPLLRKDAIGIVTAIDDEGCCAYFEGEDTGVFWVYNGHYKVVSL